MIFRWIYRNNELLIWVAALVWIYFAVDPASTGPGLCVFHRLGFDACPGCGIGRSMHAALHFQWALSWKFHWLGIPAIGIILHRIYTIINYNKTKIHEQLPDGYA